MCCCVVKEKKNSLAKGTHEYDHNLRERKNRRKREHTFSWSRTVSVTPLAFEAPSPLDSHFLAASVHFFLLSPECQNISVLNLMA